MKIKELDSNFIKSYNDLIKKIICSFNLKGPEAKNIVSIVSDWLLDDDNLKKIKKIED